MIIRENRRTKTMLMAACAALAIVPTTAYAQRAQQTRFDIKAEDLGTALTDLARQSNREIYFSADLTRGKRAPRLKGNLTVEEALSQLLSGSGLIYRVSTSGSIVVERGGQGGNGPAGDQIADVDDNGKAEILVVGSKSLNVDVKRSEDDPQPYVVFGKDEIARSNATNVEDFIRKRLTMNTTNAAVGQDAISADSASLIDLRGLGTAQTLILVDGRRSPRVLSNGFAAYQADVNGIPLASIERIEVLPSTAGGIYGGGAVGGVINIVRKRDYNGVDAQLSYDSPFEGGGQRFRADLNGGFSLNQGRTQLNIAASYSSAEPFRAGDNDLWRAGRQLYDANDSNHGILRGYTPNIRSRDGSNLVLKAGTSLGSNRTSVPVGYAGISTDQGAALAANAGRYNIDLPNDFSGSRANILTAPTVYSLNLDARQEISSWLSAFADFTYSNNKGHTVRGVTVPTVNLTVASPNNPFNQAISVTYPAINGPELSIDQESSVFAASGGFIAKLGSGWSALAEYDWSRSRQKSRRENLTVSSQLGADITSGAVMILRDLNLAPIDLSRYLTRGPDFVAGPYENGDQRVSARISGPLFDLGGGPLNLTSLAELRKESTARFEEMAVGQTSLFPARSQKVTSFYAEATAPLFSDRNAVPLLRALELDASIRYDRYNTRSADITYSFTAAPPPDPAYNVNDVDSVNYTVALAWEPVDGVRLRGSYATGFLPPAIEQLSPFVNDSTFIQGADPRRGGEPLGTVVPYSEIGSGNPNLRPETSKSFSLGAILTPKFVPGFRFSVDYTKIRKTNEINYPSYAFILANESRYPGRVTRGPQLGDGLAGPITRIDVSALNVSKAEVEAFDFNVDYRFDVGGAGDFHLYGSATYQPTYIRQAFPDSVPFERVDYSGGVLKWRGNAGLEWSYNKLRLGWNAQFYNGYSIRNADDPSSAFSQRSVDRQGAERIPSQMYHDFFVEYDLSGFSRNAFKGTLLSLAVINVFDKDPPPVAAALLGGYSFHGDPRLRRFVLTLRKHF